MKMTFVRRFLLITLIPFQVSIGNAFAFPIPSRESPPAVINEQAFVSRLLNVHHLIRLRTARITPTSSEALYSYMVLGAGGRQAVAAVYDLVKFGKASKVVMIETDATSGKKAFDRLIDLLGPEHAGKLVLQIVSKEKNRSDTIKQAKDRYGLNVVLSCLPYFLNFEAAQAAIENGVHYADLGGHMETGIKIKNELGEKAKKAGVTVITDLGLAPGLCNILAIDGLEAFKIFHEVLISCGGLPQRRWYRRLGILNYRPPFSPAGVIGNYVDGPSWAIIDRVMEDVPPFSFLKPIVLSGIKGELATTEGATATLPWTLLGKIETVLYETFRYPKHWKKIIRLNELGWFVNKESDAFEFGTNLVSPRQMTERVLQRLGLSIRWLEPQDRKLFRGLSLLSDKPYLFPSSKVTPREFFIKVVWSGASKVFPDLVLLQVIVTGWKENGEYGKMVYDMHDRYDPKTKFMSMARTTGFTAAHVVSLIADGTIVERGHVSVEDAVRGKTDQTLKKLEDRGIRIQSNYTVLEAA